MKNPLRKGIILKFSKDSEFHQHDYPLPYNLYAKKTKTSIANSPLEEPTQLSPSNVTIEFPRKQFPISCRPPRVDSLKKIVRANLKNSKSC